MIAAQQYYIDYSTDLNAERIYSLLPSYIPDYCINNGEKSLDRWGQLIIMAYKKVRIRQYRKSKPIVYHKHFTQ